MDTQQFQQIMGAFDLVLQTERDDRECSWHDFEIAGDDQYSWSSIVLVIPTGEELGECFEDFEGSGGVRIVGYYHMISR